MKRLTINIMAALWAILAMASCTVRMDRSEYPCWLSVMLDEENVASTQAGSMTVFIKETARDLREDQVDLSIYDYAKPYETTVEKGESIVTAVAGMDKVKRNEEILYLESGNQFDRLWMGSVRKTYDEELGEASVVLHKQFCQINTTINGEIEPGAEAILKGDINGIVITTLEPFRGSFEYHVPYDEEQFSVVVPRQGGSRFTITFPSKITGDRVFDLNEVFDEVGYDWSKEDLDDINLHFNLNQLAGNVLVVDYEIVPGWNGITISDSTYAMKGTLEMRDWYLSDAWDGITITDSTYWNQRNALTKLYESTGGPSWKNNTNWGSDQPIDTWYGVYTNWRGEVTSIELDNNNLHGTVDIELNSFKNLTRISLSNNFISSAKIRSEYVTDLSIYSSNLSEMDVTGCPSLKWINCGSNALQKLDIANCKYLNSLSCYDNNLKELDLRNNQNLNDINVNNNQLRALDLSAQGSLQSLYCSGNNLKEINLSACSNLHTLSCGSNSITMLDVSSCTMLDYLSCGSNALTRLDVSACSNLYNLSCDRNSLTELIVSGCKKLDYIYCSNNNLRSLDLPDMPNLTSLYCDSNLLTALDLSDCVRLNNLSCGSNNIQSLDLSGNQMLQSLACESNGLKSLDVSKCTSLQNLSCGGSNIFDKLVINSEYLLTFSCTSNEYLNSVELNCPNITEVWLGSSRKLKQLKIADPGKIETLQLDACTSLNPPDLTEFKSLRCLRWSECPLSTIDLSANPEITLLDVRSSSSLKEIKFAESSKLEGLRAASCGKLSQIDLARTPNLKYLYVPYSAVTSLDLSKVPQLEALACAQNCIKSLDISMLDNLQILSCGNQYEDMNTYMMSTLKLVMNKNQKSTWDNLWNSDRHSDSIRFPDGNWYSVWYGYNMNNVEVTVK